MMNNCEISCDCGHLSDNQINICVICDQSICYECITGNVCNLCIQHNEAVNKLYSFIEYNIHILEYIQHDICKYIRYKNILQTLRTIYNHIITYESIVYLGEAYNYLCEPEIIYNLIKTSYFELNNILINSDNFSYTE